jgi:hypothetical protein
MTFCPVCLCHVEPVQQPAVHGWTHVCRHKDHRHLVPFVISERQRDERFALPDEEVALA